jgi:MFS family permease
MSLKLTKTGVRDAESSLRYPGWKVVLAGFFGVMVSFAAIVPYTFGLYLKPLASSFGWARQSISVAFSIAALTVAAISPVLGQLLDRYGPKRIILPCIVLFSCALASLALLTPHILHLYAVFFVLGLAGNGTAYLAYSRAIASWFSKRRGLAFAVMLAGGGVGAMLLPPLTQALISHYGWRAAFAGVGCLAFVVGFPLAALFVHERPVTEPVEVDSVKTGASVRQAIGGRIFWILMVTVFLYSIGVNGAIAHLAPLLTDRGVTVQAAALAVASIGGAGIVGRLATGLFLDRFFGPRVSQIMLLLCSAGVFLLSVAATLPLGFAAAILIGFSMGSEGDITPYLLSRYFGLRKFSTLYAFSWTAFAIGGAVGPIILGRVFDVLGSYRPISIQLLAVPALIPCLLMFLLPRYEKLFDRSLTAADAPSAASMIEPVTGSAL